MTTKVKIVKCSGTQSLNFIGVGNDSEKIIFEASAEDTATRDQWVIAINELLDDWIKSPETKPNYKHSAEKTSDKAKYFKQREQEMADKIKANEEKKKKYSAGGMQHVAMAMMNRS